MIMCEDMICLECNGEGIIERYDSGGPYEIPCHNCNLGCGYVPKPRSEDEPLFLIDHFNNKLQKYEENND